MKRIFGYKEIEIFKKFYNFKINKSRKFICRFNDKKFEAKFKKSNWYFTMGDTLEIY